MTYKHINYGRIISWVSTTNIFWIVHSRLARQQLVSIMTKRFLLESLSLTRRSTRPWHSVIISRIWGAQVIFLKFDLTPNPRLLTLGDVFLVAKLAKQQSRNNWIWRTRHLWSSRLIVFRSHFRDIILERERECRIIQRLVPHLSI